ncbi:hypothetical protein ABW21_db0201568 [Orbilia brochopaga]|nr:hypothetical protein ABW21_db0201568 [Drechslerella brochopaga]
MQCPRPRSYLLTVLVYGIKASDLPCMPLNYAYEIKYTKCGLLTVYSRDSLISTAPGCATAAAARLSKTGIQPSLILGSIVFVFLSSLAMSPTSSTCVFRLSRGWSLATLTFSRFAFFFRISS